MKKKKKKLKQNFEQLDSIQISSNLRNNSKLTKIQRATHGVDDANNCM